MGDLDPDLVSRCAEAIWWTFHDDRPLPPELRWDHEQAARAVLREAAATPGNPEVRREWTLAVDCSAEGCDPPHSDDGEHGRIWDHPDSAPEQMTLNGHAARLLTRTVTTASWTPENAEFGEPVHDCLLCGKPVPRGEQWQVYVPPDKVVRWPFCESCYHAVTAPESTGCPNAHTTGTCQGCKDYAAPLENTDCCTDDDGPFERDEDGYCVECGHRD
jgi:hypothetical protein